ncbi:MAG: M23 family metallopeptidase [Solirubrobacterales bacterium]|nr:M23 family metallopeptidase [Solirubrobacterales bacterium]
MNRFTSRTGLFAAVTVLAVASLAGIAIASGGVNTGGGGGGKKGGKGAAFPVSGKHTYGDGLGAGRGHEGQDILAGCRKPIVAAKPGRVRYIDYQASGAGNYAVIKGKKFDYVYMHMIHKPSVKKGERVKAGEKIGRVGSTGRSTACHLHFEMWRKPGWYRGGRIVNPKPFLKRWDRR